MKNPFFFGYGSLVNQSTHTYTNAHRAHVTGWRRTWRFTPHHPVSLLTAIRCDESSIDGLIAEVPGADWAALDERESGYNRHVTDAVRHPLAFTPEIAIYAVPEQEPFDADEGPGILLSYLDVVVQGYLREFGEEGVADFFATTDGWDIPILNDRLAPKYPRAQELSPSETALVDAYVAKVNAGN
ncbi:MULTISPECIES: gamma-glutamylcyclotransferase family protein [Halocynthiibacter]|uniref:glutathione-specific gamma-glutamylcyclotransferase n=1 Tax=Halocynthiibacter halioticoli TaxID=2986804 RepID=A0AAE3LQI0_9RHOB|nr:MULTISPECIES: gamma-glutamylcyclotransferase family protein [Halocynthiibacter]MCV6823544.1 gamma-glutamylcyclotransferase [Halocynthiibacter halioticoli]MCW4056545.1 gamma-glutamylcyclotransferase [Halocynthiibacter sp. SDUM655004]